MLDPDHADAEKEHVSKFFKIEVEEFEVED